MKKFWNLMKKTLRLKQTTVHSALLKSINSLQFSTPTFQLIFSVQSLLKIRLKVRIIRHILVTSVYINTQTENLQQVIIMEMIMAFQLAQMFSPVLTEKLFLQKTEFLLDTAS